MPDRNIICFHNPDEENGYLSNWYLSEFQADNRNFTSMEQYMMYRKACLFQDYVIADKIMSVENAAEIKRLGREVANYNDTIWSGMRQLIVYHGLMHKFRNNIKLRQMLCATGDALLAECAVKDRIWGIGLSMADEDRFDIGKWKGQNLLGFTLMEVRKELRPNRSINRAV